MWRRLRKLVKQLQKELLSEKRIILDTSFLLPYIGLKIKEFDIENIKLLKNIELYYPYVMLPELIGTVIKIARRKMLKSIPETALKGFNSIVYGDHIHLINLVDQDLKIAYSLMLNGLKDMFDAMFYATSRRTGIKAITLDDSLVRFLKENNFNIENVILLK